VSPHSFQLRRISLPLLVFLALVVGRPPLRADTVYTNFGTGDAYASSAGVIVTNDGVAWSSVAVAFTPTANYNLSSIEFVVSDLIPDDSNDVTLGLFADNGGQPDATALEMFSMSPDGMFGDNLLVTTVSSILQPLLLADTQYWIGMNAAPGDLVVWNQNLTSATGFFETDGSGNWSAADPLKAQGVLEVDGTLSAVQPPVNSFNSSAPEPGAWLLMAGGLAALAFLRRRLNPR